MEAVSFIQTKAFCVDHDFNSFFFTCIHIFIISSLQQKIETLEAQIDVLKKTLNTAEKANEQLQEENRRSAEKFREMADKVYGRSFS